VDAPASGSAAISEEDDVVLDDARDMPLAGAATLPKTRRRIGAAVHQYGFTRFD
jgi:hypothetical protein